MFPIRHKALNKKTKKITGPSLTASLAPIALLLAAMVSIIVFEGAGAIADYSPWALLSATAVSIILARFSGSLTRRGAVLGLRRSARQILPAVPMLVCIAMVATTWMLSGVVPLLIDYGLKVLAPGTFLVITCAVCSVISVLTGSSWSTIATIGVAFMGIGTVMGFHPGWVAGAIISGAYFGDKVSPLSDTTVVASSACGVDLFKHIRYLTATAAPAMFAALAVYLIVGITGSHAEMATESEISSMLAATFSLSPWVLLIPAITFALILFRVGTLLTLFVSAMLGLAGIFIFQPAIVEMIGGGNIASVIGLLWRGLGFETGVSTFDDLAGTSGILGMLPTIALVLSAMMFGSAMIGTGMLGTISAAILARLKGRFAIVSATVASGLFINSCTADQYLSIIVGGNMYRNVYRGAGLEPRLLSRTLEDSVSVTSVLIPWNSCGVTQSTVLGVSTLVYLPFCIFNWMSPLMSLLMAYTGLGISEPRRMAATASK